LAGAGDELQGIKRGLMELADVLVVNKADGANQRPALLAAREMERALRYLVPPDAPWMPPVLTCSALEERGIDDVWAAVAAHRDALTATGELAARRQRQLIRWMWRIVEDRLITSLREHPGVQGQLADVVQQVRDHVITPAVAAERLLRAFGGDHQ
ncbi:MAG: methylmalonyl Co-A mutase-associated GTPase MeaB, partial [Planctomycetota bacterium]